MEFRIADILDTVDASDVPIEPRKVTSKGRIEELVFEKISSQKTQKHTTHKPVQMGPLVAALIVILSLSLIVGASGLRIADLFGGFFGLLSQGQKDTMDEISMIQSGGLPISVNANGTTVTLQTAIGDDRNCYLKLQFHAQENKKLYVPDNNSGTLEIYEKDYYETPDYMALLSNQQGERLHCYHELTWIDNVPGDHQLELIVELSLPTDSSISFIDDEPEMLTIPGLWTCTLSMEYTQVLDGPWVIELGKCGGQFRDLNVSGKSATYTTAGKTNTVVLDSLKMSQLGLEVRGSFASDTEGALIYSYPATMVVLKDNSIFGSNLFVGDTNDRGNGELNEASCAFSVKFDAPLDLAQVDHIRIGDLVIPFSEEGSVCVDSSGYCVDNYVLGTHVTLGDPGSLRSSGPIANLDDIGVHGAGAVSPADWYDSWTYAAHTENGVQLAHIDSEFVSGKLVYTITGADVIANINDLDTKKDGFSYEACLALDSNNEWQELDQPECIRDDGSFEDGWYLVLLNISVKNDNAVVKAKEPYLFDAGRLLTLADLRHKDIGNYRCINIDYFSGLNDYSKHQFSFYLEPGEETNFTIGYLLHASGKTDFSALRACTTTGGEMSTFVDLKLDEKATG